MYKKNRDIHYDIIYQRQILETSSISIRRKLIDYEGSSQWLKSSKTALDVCTWNYPKIKFKNQNHVCSLLSFLFLICVHINRCIYVCTCMYVQFFIQKIDRMSDIQAQASDVSRSRWFISWRRTRILKNQAWTKSLPVHASCMHAKLLQSCLTLCDPIDCSPPGSSVHGISQARTLEWISFPFSKGSSPPRDQTQVSYCRWILYQLNHQGSPFISITHR